jgi:hypothetical protein
VEAQSSEHLCKARRETVEDVNGEKGEWNGESPNHDKPKPVWGSPVIEKVAIRDEHPRHRVHVQDLHNERVVLCRFQQLIVAKERRGEVESEAEEMLDKVPYVAVKDI